MVAGCATLGRVGVCKKLEQRPSIAILQHYAKLERKELFKLISALLSTAMLIFLAVLVMI